MYFINFFIISKKFIIFSKKDLHLIFLFCIRLHEPDGGVAQLVRAPACHAGGREFEPRHSRHYVKKAAFMAAFFFYKV